MFDFSVTESTYWDCIFCSFLFLGIIGLYWIKCTSHNSFQIRNNRGSVLLAILILIFATTYWVDTDFFGYRELVQSYSPGMENFHMESVYGYIIEFTNSNYLFFRILVWGGALLCYIQIARILKINVVLSLFIMFLLFATIFSYARASLAMAIYFLGMTLMLDGREIHKSRRIFVGLVLIMSSYLFHKSMAAMILLTVFILVPINKRTVFPILFSFCLLGFGADYMVNTFQNVLMGMGDDQLLEKIEQNQEIFDSRNPLNATLFGWIPILWGYVPFYLSFFLVSKCMLRSEQYKPSMIYLYRLTFAIVVLSTVLLLFGTHSLTYFYRYLYMSFIPLSILIVYLYTGGYLKLSRYRAIIYLGGGYNIWTFISYFFA